jgi:D-apiose dehydrogenase
MLSAGLISHPFRASINMMSGFPVFVNQPFLKELGPDYWIRLTTHDGTLARRYPPPRYVWADPAYDVVHASIVPCNANLLAALRGDGVAETTAADNLKTVRLVFAAYDSARHNQVIQP